MAKKKAKKAVPKAPARKPAKATKVAPKKVAKPAKKASKPMPKKAMQKSMPVKSKPKSMSQMEPDHAEQLKKILLDANVDPHRAEQLSVTELPVHEDQKYLPTAAEIAAETKVMPPEQGDIVLQVKLRKMFFRAVKNTEVLIMANDKPFDRQTTDANGDAFFKNLSVGKYTLAATVDGKFKTKAVEVKGLGAVTFNV
jgi:hypothetical protein